VKKLLYILFSCALLLFESYSFAKQSKIDSLLTVLKTAKEDTDKVKTLYLLCSKFRFSNPDKALQYGEQGQVLARQLEFNKGTAASLYYIGIVYYYQGDYDNSLNSYLQSLKIHEELGNKIGIADNLQNIGKVYYRLHNYEKAINKLQQSLTLYEELKDSPDEAMAVVGKHGIASSLNNIGGIYEARGNYEKTLEYLFRSLEIVEKLGDKQGIATRLDNIGLMYKALGNYAKAMDYLLQALEIREALGDKKGIAYSLTDIGELYSERGDYGKALDYIQRSLKIAKEIGVKERIKASYEALAVTYARQNQFAQAYEYYRLYSAIKDSLLNEVSSRQIAEMSEKYESEKKEKQIEIQKLELNRNRILQYALGGGVVMLLLLSFVIYNRYRLKRKANELLAAQKQEIETKNKDVTDSIRYAERIQNAILPTDEQIKELLPDSFVLFKPKDIVSGDFYWIVALDPQGSPPAGVRGVLIAACDCTGHGVPGAFMSMIGNALLNEVVNDKGITQPGEILNEIRKGIINSLKQKGQIGEQQDGMDAALCNLELHDHSGLGVRLQYAGANNPLFIIRKGELMEIKADKQPIGIVGKLKPFTNHKIDLQKGDTIYIFSDGYQDQFGGPKGKKFRPKQFKELLLSIQDKSMEEQEQILGKTIDDWKGDGEQIDDMLIIGIRI